jgi:hypothetical protein
MKVRVFSELIQGESPAVISDFGDYCLGSTEAGSIVCPGPSVQSLSEILKKIL